MNIIYGTSLGLASARSQMWHQDISGIKGVAGDFEADLVEPFPSVTLTMTVTLTLAIGVSGDKIGSLSRAGAVHILYGSNTGITAYRDQ